ncbi:MAG: CaiB/BaiF CoA-transferase family protein [Candidatus Binatus sp.]|jgi:alpha-methylacyl-CoA racemase|uniref:CaiB/BaiF CoA transferase family protein n=1 Tax=Candidatus Binatus sp. TaxID=2811406 RepID=UPI003D0BB5AB
MGVLSGYRVIELAGIGPGPMCAMLLSDMGADVLRIDRTADAGVGIAMDAKYSLLNRGRRSVALDLKRPEAIEAVLRLVAKADALIEGFRPGVTERLGLGPDHCLARNPRLIYGRMTGWGQEGPLAHASGHDINYIALSGALHSIGRKGEAPVPPLNLVGDFGGGALYLALGVVAGLLEAQKSGQGQVVDAAMVDGAASLMTLIYGMHGLGIWNNERGDNILDTGAHYYDVYETRDGKYVSIGAIEAKFYEELLRLSGLKGEQLPHQQDRNSWPAMKERLKTLFRTKTRDEWCKIMEGSDVCFAPVLSMDEAPRHPHNLHRGTFVEQGGVTQPGPAPRFSRTPSAIQRPPATPGEHTEAALRDWGFADADLERLRKCGAIAPPA